MSHFFNLQSFLEAVVDFDGSAVYVRPRLWMEGAHQEENCHGCQWELPLLTAAVMKTFITSIHLDGNNYFPGLKTVI